MKLLPDFLDRFRPRPPPRRGGRPLPWRTNARHLAQIAAVWPDGRCLIARGYEDDRELAAALKELRQRRQVPARLRRESVPLAEVQAAWTAAAGQRRTANDDIRRRIQAIFAEAAAARASDLILAHDGAKCDVLAIVNDRRLALGHPLAADEGRAAMGYLFHAKDEGSSQTSYQRGEFQGFSIRSGGEVPLPAQVSGLRCQRGPHDPDGDHLFARFFYRDQLAEGTTLEKLGFTTAEAETFAEIRMSLHGGIFLGGSTGDGKSTTLAVNLALQQTERDGELNLVTLEDPVEYRIPGALQIAVPTTGSGDDRAMHFTRALMHFCRIHPASGMVSEIRDADAARQVLAAIDTGHQVWTTIHVDNANAILFRLLDMGVDPPALTKPGNVKLLMKQTLLPMLCPACKLAEGAELPSWLGERLAHMSLRFRNREGCTACQRSSTSEIARLAWTGYTRQQVVAETIRPDSGYLAHVGRRDPIGAWRYWTDELGGTPIGRRIWDLVARGLVDPRDALTKGARPDDVGPARELRLVEGRGT